MLQRVDIWNVDVFRLEQELSAGTKMNSRILVITGSADSASQYMNYMNVFFTAQKQVTALRYLRFSHWCC
jgi:transcription initiation factor TFIIH subunit 3